MIAPPISDTGDGPQGLTVLPPADGKLWHRDAPVLGEVDERLGTRPILRGGMWPSQIAWWNLPNKIRLFVGGYGSGKTIQLCKRMIAVALHNAPVECAIVSPTYPLAKQTVIPVLRNLLQSLKMWFDVWSQHVPGFRRRLTWTHLKTSPQVFTFELHTEGKRSLKATILVYSGEDPDKLVGTNLAAAGIDEPFLQEFEVFEQMHVRCRHPNARLREINCTGTPEQLNWGYDLAEGDLRDKYDVGLVQASTIENLALPIDYLPSLEEAFDPKVAQAYLHGHFINLAKGLVYYAFDKREHVVERKMPPGAELVCGMDFNVDPMSATVGWAIRKGHHRTIHWFDEIELANSDTEEMCKVLGELYGQPGVVKPWCASESSNDRYVTHAPLLTICPDSNAGRHTNAPGGKTDYDYIRDAGFDVDYRPKGNPPQRDRYNSTNGLLRPNGGVIRQTFSPRCKKLIKYQQLYAHELKTKKAQKAMSHLLDARDYAIYRLFPASRETLKQVTVRGA